MAIIGNTPSQEIFFRKTTLRILLRVTLSQQYRNFIKKITKNFKKYNILFIKLDAEHF